MILRHIIAEYFLKEKYTLGKLAIRYHFKGIEIMSLKKFDLPL
ncbi:hypothetical protein [Heyndrickxia vini]|nr:hypothetical protein [Heyndrickxia vini]